MNIIDSCRGAERDTTTIVRRNGMALLITGISTVTFWT
jgi:hypothetical protein